MCSQLAKFQADTQQQSVVLMGCPLAIYTWIGKGVVLRIGDAIRLESFNTVVVMNAILLDLQSSHVWGMICGIHTNLESVYLKVRRISFLRLLTPKIKLQKGIVYTPICHSVHRGLHPSYCNGTGSEHEGLDIRVNMGGVNMGGVNMMDEYGWNECIWRGCEYRGLPMVAPQKYVPEGRKSTGRWFISYLNVFLLFSFTICLFWLHVAFLRDFMLSRLVCVIYSSMYVGCV